MTGRSVVAIWSQLGDLSSRTVSTIAQDSTAQLSEITDLPSAARKSVVDRHSRVIDLGSRSQIAQSPAMAGSPGLTRVVDQHDRASPNLTTTPLPDGQGSPVSTDARRREIGESDAPVEDEINESFHQIVNEGAQRLHRTWRTVLVTGTFGGLEIGVGVMAYLAVQRETGSHLLAGLAFGVGFMALLLAKSELFTENFLVPITAVMAGEGRGRDLLRLYGATMVTNLAAGWLFMWLVVLAFPQWTPTLTEAAVHFVSAPIGAESICLAVLGGSTITLMTRMQHGTQSDVAKIAARSSPHVRITQPLPRTWNYLWKWSVLSSAGSTTRRSRAPAVARSILRERSRCGRMRRSPGGVRKPSSL